MAGLTPGCTLLPLRGFRPGSRVELHAGRFGLYSPLMKANAFIGKQEPPSDNELSAALGSSKKIWDQLLAELAAEYDLTSSEWHS